MRRSEVLAWLESGSVPGQKGQAKIEQIEVPNPSPSEAERIKNPKILVKKVTWTRNDGETLTVIDYERRNQDAVIADFVDTPEGTKTYDPDYEVIGGEPKRDPTDNRTEEDRRHEAELDRQRRQNREGHGIWETDAERRQRERQENEDRRRTDAEERANTLREQELEIRRQAEARAAAAEERAAGTDARRAEVEGRRLTLEEEKYNFERERANRPEIVSKPTDEDEQIAIFNPATGQVEAQANPLYNAKKTESKRKAEELTLAIQQNKMTAEAAAAEYDRWFKENVEVPFLRAAEARAQATEKRQALEAEERRRQFKAQHELERIKFGQQAGQDAAENEIALLPYRVGPEFGDQFSSAVNSLAAGGRMATNAAAGINFTDDAFMFKKPNLEKIARKATSAALRNLTSYTPDATPYATADYSGINMPSADTMQTAPAAPTFIDTKSRVEDYRNTRYMGPTP